jgi:hypothetical protein
LRISGILSPAGGGGREAYLAGGSGHEGTKDDGRKTQDAGRKTQDERPKGREKARKIQKRGNGGERRLGGSVGREDTKSSLIDTALELTAKK